MSESAARREQEKTTNPIGVFMDCLGKPEPDAALAAVRAVGLDLIQVGKLPDRFYCPAGAAEFGDLMRRHGIRAASVVMVFDGERYDDVRAVQETVGYRPSRFLAERLAYSRKCVDLAAALGVGIVTTHIGYLPREVNDPVYQQMFRATREVAAYAAARGVTLSLETGQETGEELAAFLDRIPEYRIGVNFDTANLILYGMEDSPGALRRLLPRVTSVHVKDGLPPAQPGALGVETRLGEGKGQVRECLALLRQANFRGPLIIENYVAAVRGTDPADEVRRAKEFIERALAAIGGSS